jgi:hypothetical protein
VHEGPSARHAITTGISKIRQKGGVLLHFSGPQWLLFHRQVEPRPKRWPILHEEYQLEEQYSRKRDPLLSSFFSI